MNVYVSGTRVRSAAFFADFSGNPTDPDTTTLKYRSGSGSVQTVANPTRDSVGAFHFDIDTTGWTGPGNLLYVCQWQGTGAVQAVDDDYFGVKAPTL